MATQILNRRYKIIRQLGEGGMGAVFLVEDMLRDNALLALKTVRASQTGEYSLAQFKYEFAVLAQLHHPNLVKVYDFGYMETQEYFFTMDYVSGEDWGTATRRRVLSGTFDAPWLYGIVVQVCYALQYIHARGFIHYDVKPFNVRITPEGQVKLMDFGLIGQPQGAGRGPARGTPEYIAPEVAQGAPVDHRADLYSLGVSLYEIVTGRLPSRNPVGDWTETDPFLSGAEWSHLSLTMPAGLHSMIRTLLAPMPEDRYGSATAVIRAINTLTKSNYPLETEAAHRSMQSGLLAGHSFETAYLQEVLLRMLDGHGRLVLLTGTTGVGKSRLARELGVYAQMQRVLVCEGVCDEHALTPYRPWVTIFRQLITQCSTACMEKLQRYGVALLNLMPELADVLDADFDLQRSPGEKDRLLTTVVDGLLSFEQPLLLVLEDLHYADAETLELLDRVGRRARQGHILLVGLYRDAEIEASHPLQALVHHARPVSRREQPPSDPEYLPELLHIELLDEAAASQLTCALLGAGIGGESRLPEGFLAWLMTETGGNPLFIESLLRSLIEDNLLRYDGETWQMDIEAVSRTPDNIQEIARRRVARLDAAALHILQWAAVLGQWLDPPVLAAVSGASADEIFRVMTQATRRYVLTLSARAGEATYRFSNDQVRIVLYHTLTPAERAQRHALCADTLRQRYPDSDIAEVLTWHYEQAGQLAQALQYAQMAGDKARQVYAHHSAVRYYSQALDFSQRASLAVSPQTLYALRWGRANAYAYLERYQAQRDDLARMSQLATLMADVTRQIETHNLQVTALGLLGDHEEALRLGAETLALARQTGDSLLIVDSLDVLGEAHSRVGDIESAYTLHKEALRLCRELGDRQREAHLLWHLGGHARVLKGIAETRVYMEESFELQRVFGNQAGMADALNALGVISTDYVQKRDYHEQSLAIVQAIGDRNRQTRSYNNLGLAYWRLGLYTRAREYLERAIQMEREVFSRSHLALLLESLGRVYFALEDYMHAQQAFEEGLSMGEATGDYYSASLHYFGMGQVKLASGHPEAARALFTRAVEIQREHKMLNLLFSSQAWLGAACLAIGDWELADRYTLEALCTLQVIGTGEFLAQEVWWLRYQVLRCAAPERREALTPELWEALQRAHDVMMDGIATITDEGLRRNYLNKVRVNRDIIAEWTRRLAEQSQQPESSGPLTSAPTLEVAASEAEQLRDRFKRVLDISVRMNETHDAESLLRYVMDQVIELSGAERGVLALLDRQHQIHFRVAVGIDLPELVNGKSPISYTILETLIQSRQPVLLQDALTDARFGAQSSVLELNLRSVLCVPLIARAELIGLIYADNRSVSGRFSDMDLNLMMIFANQAATAIENARLYGDLVQANVQLETWAHTLEARVAERTAEVEAANAALSRRAVQLETSRQVAQQIISILDLDVLLERVVSLIQSQFGYAFVGVWLVNSNRDGLVLRASADPLARRLQEKGLVIPLDAPSLSVSVCRTGKARVVQNVQEAADFWSVPVLPPIASELVLPLQMGEEIVGTLSIGGDQIGQFVEEEIGVLHGVADQLVIAIRNAQLYQAEQRRRKLTELLEQTGRELTSSLDMRTAPERILAFLSILTPYARGLVMLREGDVLKTVAHYGLLDSHEAEAISVPITEDDIYQQLEALGRPLIVHDTTQESGWKQIPSLPIHRSWMGVPLIAKGQSIGMISLTRREPYAFTEEDATWVQAFAVQASIALENARYHTALLQFNAQLEEIVHQRTRELDEANRILTQLNKTKSNFISIAAHELFTPLTAISSFAQLMRRQVKSQTTPPLGEYLEGILTGARRMQDVIDRMRDVARINLQTWEVSHANVLLGDLLRQIGHGFARALEERHLTLTFVDLDTLPIISGDAEMLYKAFYHVIINAIKYTPDGGRITVSGFETTLDNDYPGVEVIVADTGIGIDPQALEVIFESFYQTGAVEHHFSGDTQYKAGGPGLGLTIARGLVAAHGGKIWAESEAYDEARYPGSRFHIQLPVHKPDEKQEIGNEI